MQLAYLENKRGYNYRQRIQNKTNYLQNLTRLYKSIGSNHHRYWITLSTHIPMEKHTSTTHYLSANRFTSPAIYRVLNLRRQEIQIHALLFIIVTCTRNCSCRQSEDLIASQEVMSKCQSPIHDVRQVRK